MAPSRRAAFDAVGGCMATVGHLWPLGDSGTCGRETCAELIIVLLKLIYKYYTKYKASGTIIISVKNLILLFFIRNNSICELPDLVVAHQF